MPRAVKTKMMGGRMVSAKSKTGDPQCSAAMSAWQNIRRGNAATMALDVAMGILGKCRAKARALKQAGQHRTAGNEARAQVLEKRAASGGPVSAKDRLAKARELRAGRAQKTTAAPVAADIKTLAAKAAAHNRLYNEGGEGFNPHSDALAKAKAAQHAEFRKGVENRFKVKEARLVRYADSARVQSNPQAVRAFQLEGRKAGRPLEGMSGALIQQNRNAVAKALRDKNPAVVSKWKEARAKARDLRAQRTTPAPQAAPSLREQAAKHRAGNIDRDAAARALKSARASVHGARDWKAKPTPSNPGSLVYDKGDRELLKATADRLKKEAGRGLKLPKLTMRQEAAKASDYSGASGFASRQRLNAMVLAIESTRKYRVAARRKAASASPR